MKRFLITTADERTWRRECPVLFLGEWCRLHARRAIWQGLDAEVVPYHWDDREQLHHDYDRLGAIYEQLLHRTTAALNGFHGTTHSARYWRILAGTWLWHFVHVLFDRWTTIQRAADGYEIADTLVYDLPPERMIPFDLGNHFHDTTWNHYIFGKVIAHQDSFPWRSIAAPAEALLRAYTPPAVGGRALTAAVRNAVSWVLGRFTMSDEALIIRTYLPRMAEIKLQLALGQVPKLWVPPEMEPVAPDMRLRRQLQIDEAGLDPFARFVATMIPQQIPTAYLEGFERLQAAAARLPWPSRPRVIFTSNLDLFCTVFKAWTAAKVEAGHPFVIGQHGGFIGVAKRHPVEDHQLQVCDRYLSWGWQDGFARVQPAMVFTNVGKPIATWNPSGNLLLVTAPHLLFAHRSMSQPVGAIQSARCVEEQIRFGGALDERIRATLTLRIHAALDREMGTGYVAKWKEALPSVDIDPSIEPIEGAIRRCRLFVYTYNSTGFLETLARNIPTLLFWNPEYYELRPTAEPYFDLLAKAGIFHDTSESAAQHAGKIWDDVAGWWQQPAVQNARRTFCEQYARMPEHPIRVLKEALLTVPHATVAAEDHARLANNQAQ